MEGFNGKVSVARTRLLNDDVAGVIASGASDDVEIMVSTAQDALALFGNAAEVSR